MKPFAVVHRSSRTFLAALPALLALAATGTVAPALAQEPLTDFKRPPVQTRQFGDLAEGPYNRLVIQNVNVLPGHGGPSVGLYDILIEGNEITEMKRFATQEGRHYAAPPLHIGRPSP